MFSFRLRIAKAKSEALRREIAESQLNAIQATKSPTPTVQVEHTENLVSRCLKSFNYREEILGNRVVVPLWRCLSSAGCPVSCLCRYSGNPSIIPVAG